LQLVKEVTCELPSRQIVKVVWLYMYMTRRRVNIHKLLQSLAVRFCRRLGEVVSLV